MKVHRDLDLSYYDGFSVFRLVRSGFSLPFPLAFVAAAVFRVIFLFSDMAMASLAGGPNLVWRDAWRYPGLRRATASSNSALSVERWIATRRVLRVITAPIFSSFRRMVPAWALAILVPAKASRRIVSIKL